MSGKAIFGVAALVVGGALIYYVIRTNAAATAGGNLTVSPRGVSGNINLTPIETGIGQGISSLVNGLFNSGTPTGSNTPAASPTNTLAGDPFDSGGDTSGDSMTA